MSHRFPFTNECVTRTLNSQQQTGTPHLQYARTQPRRTDNLRAHSSHPRYCTSLRRQSRNLACLRPRPTSRLPCQRQHQHLSQCRPSARHPSPIRRRLFKLQKQKNSPHCNKLMHQHWLTQLYSRARARVNCSARYCPLCQPYHYVTPYIT